MRWPNEIAFKSPSEARRCRCLTGRRQADVASPCPLIGSNRRSVLSSKPPSQLALEPPDCYDGIVLEHSLSAMPLWRPAERRTWLDVSASNVVGGRGDRESHTWPHDFSRRRGACMRSALPRRLAVLILGAAHGFARPRGHARTADIYRSTARLGVAGRGHCGSRCRTKHSGLVMGNVGSAPCFAPFSRQGWPKGRQS